MLNIASKLRLFGAQLTKLNEFNKSTNKLKLIYRKYCIYSKNINCIYETNVRAIKTELCLEHVSTAKRTVAAYSLKIVTKLLTGFQSDVYVNKSG